MANCLTRETTVLYPVLQMKHIAIWRSRVNEVEVNEIRTPGPPTAHGGRSQEEDLIKEAEHGDQMVTIIVDGTPHEVPKRELITYAEVVTLAYPDYPQHPEITYSVTFTKGHSEKPEGILPPGGSVRVKEGMAFVVDRTGQS